MGVQDKRPERLIPRPFPLTQAVTSPYTEKSRPHLLKTQKTPEVRLSESSASLGGCSKGPWNRMQRFLIDRPGPTPATVITEFYREEFMKHHRCLQEQREYFSSQAIDSVESALVRVISQVDALSSKADADQVVARLLKEFDVVTRLSAWSDPHKAH